MAIVNSNNELLKQPACFSLLEGAVMVHAMTLNVVHQIPSGCKFTDNGQVFRGEEDLMQLYDVWVHAT